MQKKNKKKLHIKISQDYNRNTKMSFFPLQKISQSLPLPFSRPHYRAMLLQLVYVFFNSTRIE